MKIFTLEGTEEHRGESIMELVTEYTFPNIHFCLTDRIFALVKLLKVWAGFYLTNGTFTPEYCILATRVGHGSLISGGDGGGARPPGIHTKSNLYDGRFQAKANDRIFLIRRKFWHSLRGRQRATFRSVLG